MISVTCIAQFALCVVLPIHFTLNALNNSTIQPIQQKKWAVFWGINAMLMLIWHSLDWLNSGPFIFIKTLFLVWLYHPDFMGAMLIAQIVEKKTKPFSAQINGMQKSDQVSLSKLSFLRLVEHDDTKKE